MVLRAAQTLVRRYEFVAGPLPNGLLRKDIQKSRDLAFTWYCFRNRTYGETGVDDYAYQHTGRSIHIKAIYSQRKV